MLYYTPLWVTLLKAGIRVHMIDPKRRPELAGLLRAAKVPLKTFHVLASELERHIAHAKSQHPEESAEQLETRALYRIRSLEHRIIGMRPRRDFWHGFATITVLAVFLGLLLFALTSHAQSITTLRGTSKGTTTPAPVTATPTDANHTGLDVNCVSGCAGGGGTASSVTVADGTTSTQKLAVDAAGKIGINNHPAFIFDVSGNLKTALQNASIAVTGTFWQATQPISSTQLPAALDTNGFFKVHEQGIPHFICDSGCFQSTQPISGSVSVSNFPATQPVSGSVSVSNFPASQAVTGTFFQATQPVSGTVTANQGGAPWSNNVSQFGGSAVATGQGAAGAGVPRVTASAADPCQDPNILKSSAAISLASSTATAIVALTSAQVVYVCSATYSLAGTTPSSLWTSATTCGTSPTNLTGIILPTTGTLVSLGGAGHTAFATAASANLCLTLAGTSPSAQGVLTYVKK